MSKNNGGPAFPCLNAEFTGVSSDGQERFEVEPSGGMALRDYFAAKAMQAMNTNPYWDDQDFSDVAKASYQMADSMLAERENEQ